VIGVAGRAGGWVVGEYLALAFHPEVVLLPEAGEQFLAQGFQPALMCRISGEVPDAVGVGLEVAELVGDGEEDVGVGGGIAEPRAGAGVGLWAALARRLPRQPPPM